jgi:hypothetical protein
MRQKDARRGEQYVSTGISPPVNMSMVPKAAIMAQKARGLLFGFCRSFSIPSLLDSMGLYYIA